MKILSAILLGILYLAMAPVLIVFLGGAELYKLYEETYNSVIKYLDQNNCKDK